MENFFENMRKVSTVVYFYYAHFNITILFIFV